MKLDKNIYWLIQSLELNFSQGGNIVKIGNNSILNRGKLTHPKSCKLTGKW